MKLNDIIHQALIEHTKDRKESTVYKLKKTSLCIPKELLDKHIKEISYTCINTFFNELYYQGYSYNYINSFYSLFSITFRYASVHELIDSNPFLKIRKFKKTEYIQKSTNYLNIEQFNLFLSCFDSKNQFYTYKLFIKCLFWIGCRKGELLAIKWSDISLSGTDIYQLHISKTCSYDLLNRKQLYTITTPKTKNSIRTISLPKFLYTELMNYKEKHCPGCSQNDFVFGGYRPLATTSIQRHFTKALDKAKKLHSIPHIRVHDLRHSHVSILINQKVYIYDIARRVGDTVETILNTYAHWFPAADLYIAEKLNELNK